MPLEIARKQYGRKRLRKSAGNSFAEDRSKMSPRPICLLSPKFPNPSLTKKASLSRKRRGAKKKKGDVYRCHVCCHKDYTYRLAFCSTPGCGDAYCYGVLYRAFDLMPQDVMQDEHWKCPKCRKICNCGACRRQGVGDPYTPKNTLLGHDTRPIADDRSVESLVDFRMHNLQWLKNSGDESRSLHSKRMQKLKQAAEAEKAKETSLVQEAATALPEAHGTERGTEAHPQDTADSNSLRPDNAAANDVSAEMSKNNGNHFDRNPERPPSTRQSCWARRGDEPVSQSRAVILPGPFHAQPRPHARHGLLRAR